MSDPASRPDAPEPSESKTRLVRILGWTGSALAILAFVMAAVALSGHQWILALAMWVLSVVCLLVGWGLAAAVWWWKPAEPAEPAAKPRPVDLHDTRSSHER